MITSRIIMSNRLKRPEQKNVIRIRETAPNGLDLKIRFPLTFGIGLETESMRALIKFRRNLNKLLTDY